MTGSRDRSALPAAPGRDAAVLHVTSAAGGGVDRYIRDHFSRNVARSTVTRLIARARGSGIPKAA